MKDIIQNILNILNVSGKGVAFFENDIIKDNGQETVNIPQEVLKVVIIFVGKLNLDGISEVVVELDI